MSIGQLACCCLAMKEVDGTRVGLILFFSAFFPALDAINFIDTKIDSAAKIEETLL